MKENEVNILYQFNNKYAAYAGVSITSLLINNKHMKMNIHVFDDPQDPVSEDNKNKFAHLAKKYGCNILFYNTKPLISIMEQCGIPKYRGSYSTNMKLFAQRLLPNINGRLLYIDSDTIVNGVIDELFNMPIDDCILAMVSDSLGRSHRFEIGLEKKDNYFNAGIIVFDLARWKEENIEEKILYHVNYVRAHYPAPDQDLINIICRGRIFKLLPKYNLQPIHLICSPEIYLKYFEEDDYYTKEELLDSVNNGVIFHCFRFVGEFPWHKGNVHPCNELFNRYMMQSEWKDYTKKEAEVGIVLRFEKILYSILPRKMFIAIFAKAHRNFMKTANSQSIKNKNNRNM